MKPMTASVVFLRGIGDDDLKIAAKDGIRSK